MRSNEDLSMSYINELHELYTHTHTHTHTHTYIYIERERDVNVCLFV